MYRHAVQDLTKFNVTDWLHFLRKFVIPEMESKDAEVWTISPNPLLILEMKSKDRDKKKKREKNVDENLIFFEPSQDQVMENLKSPLVMLIDTINTFVCLEPDIVRMLNLKRESSFPVTEMLPLFKESLAYVEELTNKGFQEPNVV